MDKATKRTLYWLATALVIIGAFLAVIFSGGGSSDETTLTGAGFRPITSADWIKGNPEATVSLIEFSDFQCPACRDRAALVNDLLDEFGDHIKFAYRHFPLKSKHQNAEISAQAAEAAGLQGKFWEMHDMLFEGQATWEKLSGGNTEEIFIGYAETLGLDIDKFKDDIDSREVKKFVDEDFTEAMSNGINSTPTFLLNEKIIRPANYEEFRTIIREAIGTP